MTKFTVTDGFAGNLIDSSGIEFANPFQGATDLPDGDYRTETYYVRDPQNGDEEMDRYIDDSHSHNGIMKEIHTGCILVAISLGVSNAKT